MFQVHILPAKEANIAIMIPANTKKIIKEINIKMRRVFLA